MTGDPNGIVTINPIRLKSDAVSYTHLETKYFKMVYPNGWTVSNSGIATSKKYKGLDAQVMYSGAAMFQ